MTLTMKKRIITQELKKLSAIEAWGYFDDMRESYEDDQTKAMAIDKVFTWFGETTYFPFIEIKPRSIKVTWVSEKVPKI